MDKWRRKFQQFMAGRYGADPFSRFLSGCIVALLVVNLFVRTHILYWLAVILLIYTYYRMFSRNISRRYAENQAFLAKTYGIRGFFRKQKNIWKQRKDYHIYTCPGCRQKIRIPRGKGRIEIRCPKCGKTFIKKS